VDSVARQRSALCQVTGALRHQIRRGVDRDASLSLGASAAIRRTSSPASRESRLSRLDRYVGGQWLRCWRSHNTSPNGTAVLRRGSSRNVVSAARYLKR